MFGSIVYTHTKMTFALVYNQLTALEYGFGFLVLIVKVVKGDEVSNQAIKVAEDIKETIHHFDIFALFFYCQVLSHQIQKVGFIVLFYKCFYTINSQTFHCCTGFGGFPSCIFGQLGGYAVPHLFGNNVAFYGYCFYGLEIFIPCRVDRCIYVYFCLTRNMSKRIGCYIGALVGKIFGTYSLYARCLYVQSSSAAWRKSSQFRTHKEISYLLV